MADLQRLIALLLLAFPAASHANYMPPCAPGDTLRTNDPGQFISYYTTGDSDLQPSNPGVVGLGATSNESLLALQAASLPAYIAKHPISGTCNAFNSRTDRSAHRVMTTQNLAFDFQNISCTTQAVTGSGTQQHAISGRTTTSNPTQYCELAPPGCDAAFVGSKIASFYDTGVGAPVQVCDTNSGCVAERLDNSGTCGPTQCGVYYKIFADVDCADVDPLPAPVPENSIAPAPQENCQTIGNAEYCIGSTPDGKNANCGYLNDQWVCVNATPKLGCQTGAGGVVCDAAAGAPPAPDSGIPGVKAAPDGQIKAETGTGNVVNTYNYFNSTTVSGSSRAPATGSPTGGGGGDTNGSGFTGDGDGTEESEEGGTGTASGGESCASAPVCEGDPIQCAILAQQWRSRCLALSTVSEIQGQAGLTAGEVDGTVLNSTEAPVEFGQLSEAGPLGGGSCPPAITFSVMGQSISLDVWAGACDLAVMVSPLLLALSYFGAALLVYRGVIA